MSLTTRPARGSSTSSRGPRRRPVRRRLRIGNPSSRLRFLLVAVLILLSVVATRVVELQTIQGPTLAAAAAADRTRTVQVAPQRGEITDRDGAPLAVSVDARNITADQTLVTDPAAAGQALASVLGGDAGSYADRLTGTRRFVYVAKDVTPQTWSTVQALEIPGIYSEPTTKRVYPAGTTAANVIGFVGAEGTGLGGLEYGLQTELAGTPGTKQYQSSARGQEIPTAGQSGTDAVPGLGVQLTIDSDLQYYAQQEIAAQVRKYRADWGQVTVMDPRTGEILALAVAPTFDPNDPGASGASDRGNRALTDAFEPGSIGKLATWSAVIDQGAATPTTHFTVPWELTRADKVFHDSEEHGTLKLTSTGVLARSSNVGTVLAADKIGGATLYSYLKKFGLGSPTGLNFPGENKGSVPAPNTWSGTTFPTLAFGQGYSVNSVQAASIFATIANDGVRVAPSLVKGYVLPDGTVQQPAAPATTQVVSAATARTMRTMLEAVVSDEGTARNAAIDGYRVAGKTATAQRINPKTGHYPGGGYVSSFVGMAPADDPQLVVAVTLNNPKGPDYYGSVVAAPVFKDVMTFALQQQQIAPTGSDRPKLPVTWGRSSR